MFSPFYSISKNVRPCMVAEHTAPFAREEMSKEPVPFRCRLSARMNKPGRQTRSSIQERHEGMPTGIYTRPESLELCF